MLIRDVALRRVAFRSALPALVALAALLAGLPRLQAQQVAGTMAAATENELATREALRQMAAGGNAIDAAVSAALVGGVASPTSSGIGGGGFALVWLAAEQTAFLLDFRETAPRGLDVQAFEAPIEPGMRGKLVGVPGEVVGLFELSRRFGKRKWSELVAPAARHAKLGFPVGKHLATMLLSSRDDLLRDPGITSVFFPGGKPAAAGKLVKNPKLATTLERIASGGPAAFTQGAVAADIARAAATAGGALTADEIERYRPVERQPLKVSWEGYDVYTMPPPSAGGLILAETLALYSRAELRRLGRSSGAYHHLVAEAFRGAIADRMRRIGDPDIVPIALDELLAPARMAARKASIALDRTHAIPRFGLEGGGTHHLVTADALGNVVSLTTTVNRVFGAKLTGAESGVVLNDELDDFTRKKDVAAFGLSDSPNRPRAGARPVSSMTPTIVVRDGRAVLALGGSGGPTIPINVTQTLLGRLVFDESPRQAVAARRFYVPSSRATIMLEPGAPPELRRDLEWRGEIVGSMTFSTSAVQMIAVEGNRKLPASDPRKHGSALAR